VRICVALRKRDNRKTVVGRKGPLEINRHRVYVSSPSRSSSSTHPSSATSHSRNSKGTLRLTDVKPVAHQDQVAGMGTGFVSVYDVADASWEQVASSQSFNGLLSDKPGVGDWSGGPHDGGAGNALDPTNGDVVGQLLNGLGHPLQGEGHRGSVFQNEVNGGAGSDGGDGHLLDFKNTPGHDPHTEDHGPFNKPLVTEPDSGSVSSVPEPGSLVLVSLGLIAIILWGKFRSAR
jgi:PEP-CTERM motif